MDSHMDNQKETCNKDIRNKDSRIRNQIQLKEQQSPFGGKHDDDHLFFELKRLKTNVNDAKIINSVFIKFVLNLCTLLDVKKMKSDIQKSPITIF